jgi:hypothetical protein
VKAGTTGCKVRWYPAKKAAERGLDRSLKMLPEWRSNERQSVMVDAASLRPKMTSSEHQPCWGTRVDQSFDPHRFGRSCAAVSAAGKLLPPTPQPQRRAESLLAAAATTAAAPTMRVRENGPTVPPRAGAGWAAAKRMQPQRY